MALQLTYTVMICSGEHISSICLYTHH